MNDIYKSYYLDRAKELSSTWEGIADLLEMFEDEECELEKMLTYDAIVEEVEDIEKLYPVTMKNS